MARSPISSRNTVGRRCCRRRTRTPGGGIRRDKPGCTRRNLPDGSRRMRRSERYLPTRRAELTVETHTESILTDWSLRPSRQTRLPPLPTISLIHGINPLQSLRPLPNHHPLVRRPSAVRSFVPLRRPLPRLLRARHPSHAPRLLVWEPARKSPSSARRRHHQGSTLRKRRRKRWRRRNVSSGWDTTS